MSFAFGFSGNDISDGEDSIISTKEDDTTSGVVLTSEVVEPHVHTLQDLLGSLTNVRLTFDTYETPQGNIVYRRELFDIKHQVMSEEDGSANEVLEILIGNNANEVDVRSNVYEGGFKSWECSYDLVDQIHQMCSAGELANINSVLELGCGTALPTAYLFMLTLTSSPSVSPSTFVLSDFNYEVLRLVSLPNILLHYASTLPPKDLTQLMQSDINLAANEVLLTPAFLDHFNNVLHNKKISLVFVSGSWGVNFNQIICSYSPDLILSSETIYSPRSLPIFVDTLIQAIGDKQFFLTLIAAKTYYFGVGGSVKEFLDILHSKTASTFSVSSIGGLLGQLKREVIKISPTQ